MPRTWNLLKQAAHILLESTPPEVDFGLLEGRLRAIPGVIAVHELHMWTIISGIDAMSGHLVLVDMADGIRVLRAARQMMAGDFGIDHVTIQIENEELRAEEKNLRV